MPLYSIAMPGLAVSKRLALADNRQNITAGHSADADSRQVLSALLAWDADTTQSLFISPRYSAAMPGLAISKRVTLADNRQVITNSHQVSSDTRQVIFIAHVVEADIKHIIYAAFDALADLLARVRSDAFYFRGEHIWDHNGSLLTESAFDGIPETREITMDVPGRPGVYYLGTEDGERVFRLRLGFNVNSTHQAKMRDLAAWLNPRAGECELRFDAEPDKFYMMRVARKWQLPGRPLWVEFDVEFRGSDPYAYGNQLNYSSAGASPLALAMANLGTIETPMTITLTPSTGAVTAVTLALGSQVMTVSGPFTQALTIDTAKMTAVTSGANAVGQVGGDWLTLPPGENTLNVSWTGGSLTVAVSFRPRWL